MATSSLGPSFESKYGYDSSEMVLPRRRDTIFGLLLLLQDLGECNLFFFKSRQSMERED